MTNQLFINIIGWIGAVFLLLAYVLVSQKKLMGDSVSYQLLNAGGGLCLIVNTYYYGAFPSVAVNVIWIGISAIFIVKKLKKD